MSARVPKTKVCLWFDHDVEHAARFYANGGQETMKKIDVAAIEAAVRADA